MKWPFARAAREIKESATGALVYMQTLGRAVWTPRDYESLSREAYVKNAVAYRCVRLISEAAASIDWLVYEGERDLETHPLLDLLQRPNPMEGGPELMERFYSFLLLSGNTYLEAVVLDRSIRELWVLRPDRMRVEVNRRGYPAAFIYKVGQAETRFQMDIGRSVQQPILHFKSFHPTNDHYGMGAVEAGAFAIDAHNSAGAFNKALLDNQARPSGALVYSGGKDGRGTMTDDQFSRMKRELDEKYTGTRNAGRPLLLEGGLDWKEMGTTPRDLEFVEGKREAAREVALAFGVPPMLLGIPGDNTYANYAEANKAFYRQTVLPLVGKVCMAITNFMTPTYGDRFRLWYDIDEIPALAVERDAVWEKIKTADWLTVDEKREATGYEPYKSPTPAELEREPGRVLLVPASVVPIDDMGLTLGGSAEDGDPARSGNPPPASSEGVPEDPEDGADDAETQA